MSCDAIVNTANEYPVIGPGCDSAVYKAAGRRKLLSYRKKYIGRIDEGEVFITPGFGLQAKYIIHTVSPLYKGGDQEEEKKLRSCYQKSLALALDNGVTSIAFPLISTGSYQYPKEEGMRIALDEINAFLLEHDMLVWLVVYDDKAASLGKKLYPELRSYIDRAQSDRGDTQNLSYIRDMISPDASISNNLPASSKTEAFASRIFTDVETSEELEKCSASSAAFDDYDGSAYLDDIDDIDEADFLESHRSKLSERLEHMSDTFSEYLMYLIQSKGMTNAEVYKRAIVDKKVFSKIKNNKDAHPQKMTAMCLCIGAKLNLDESKDLLARAGYALSPSNKTDIIFSYFIENHIYDMIELDIQLEEYGQPCLIS